MLTKYKWWIDIIALDLTLGYTREMKDVSIPALHPRPLKHFFPRFFDGARPEVAVIYLSFMKSFVSGVKS